MAVLRETRRSGGDAKAKAKVMVYIPQNLHRAAKQIALDEDLPVSDIYARAVRDHLTARGVTLRETEPPRALVAARTETTADDLLTAIKDLGLRLERLVPADRPARPGERPTQPAATAMLTLLKLVREAGDAGIASDDLDRAMTRSGLKSGTIETARAVMRGAGLVRYEKRRWYMPDG